MPGFSEEKRARLRALARGEFLQSSDPAVDAFLKRMEAEKAPVFADVYAGEMNFFNAPRRSDLTKVDVACIGIPFEASAPVRGGTRLGPRSFREVQGARPRARRVAHHPLRTRERGRRWRHRLRQPS